jgi:hypothetical protein
MKKLLFILIIAAGYLLPGCQKPEKEVYLFSYFKNNGEDGLHWLTAMTDFRGQP